MVGKNQGNIALEKWCIAMGPTTTLGKGSLGAGRGVPVAQYQRQDAVRGAD